MVRNTAGRPTARGNGEAMHLLRQYERLELGTYHPAVAPYQRTLLHLRSDPGYTQPDMGMQVVQFQEGHKGTVPLLR